MRHWSNNLLCLYSAVESGSVANNPVGVFYFSHATMIDMLSARMGLADDSLPLMGDNYPEESRRQFRTSHIIPFAGNILAVLYKWVNSNSWSKSWLCYWEEYYKCVQP